MWMMTTKDIKRFCTIWLMTVLSTSLVGGYQDGAREESCYNMLVIHPNTSSQSCPNPCDVQLHLRARVEGGSLTSSVDLTTYECGALYELELNSTSSPFVGYLLEAHAGDRSVFNTESGIVGTFEPAYTSNAQWHTINCSSSGSNTLGPTYPNAATQNTADNVTSVRFYWRAPPSPQTCEEANQLPEMITFWYTIVRQYLQYYNPSIGPQLAQDPQSCGCQPTSPTVPLTPSTALPTGPPMFRASCTTIIYGIRPGFVNISTNCTANRPVASARCFDNGIEQPCNFPIPLLTEFGSSTVMVVFRDREGNTAVSGGVARFSAGTLFIGSVDPATSLVQFNPSTYSVNEHDPIVTLLVERVGNTSMALVIDFSTTAGTALGDMDFTVTSGSITFQPSETQKSITIRINDDSVAEEMEHFFVQLSLPDGSLINETNVILGAVNRSVVNIIDSQDSSPSMSSNGCPAGPDPVWDITWANTPPGERDTQSCPRSEGRASRYCDESSNWAEPNVLECESTEFREIRLEAERIFGSNATLEEVLAQATALTARLNASTAVVTVTRQSLLPQDLNTSNSILSSTITALQDSTGFNTTTDEPQEVIVDIFNNLLNDNNGEGWRSLQMVGAGSQLLLNNAERFGLYVANTSDTATVFERPNIMVSAMQYRQGATMSVSFPTSGDLSMPATIMIPSQILQERLQEGESIPVVNILFQNLEGFLPTAAPDFSNNSRAVSVVLSSQVALQSSSSLVLQEHPVTLSFTFEQEADNQDTFRCVFWNFSDPIGSGGWISDGVRTVQSTRSSQGRTTVQCESTHLTSFAVLVDITGVNSQLEALRVVSYIGCAISLVCLTIAIIFYLFHRKKLFKPSPVRFVHLNLAISLFLAYLTFAVGVEIARSHKVSCIVVAALLHYLFLAAFCWMLCEGVMMFLLLVVVFSKLSNRWWFFLLIGYERYSLWELLKVAGVPILVVVVGLAVRHEYYGVKDEEGRLLFCWLSTEKGVIWAFAAPVLGIIAINLVFFCLAVWRVLQAKKNQHAVKEKEPIKIAVSLLKATVVLLPLLGLTWVFGLLTVDQNTAFFAWIFTILNSLQGAGILFFHVVRDKLVWPKLTSCLASCYHKIFAKRSVNRYTLSSVKGGSTVAQEKKTQEVAHVNTESEQKPLQKYIIFEYHSGQQIDEGDARTSTV